jgi:Predicted permease
MGLSVNKTVWQYMAVIAVLLVLTVSFLFYIRPVFIALIIGLLITVLLDKIADLFLKSTKKHTVKERNTIAVACFICVIIVVGAVAVAGAISLKNNVNSIWNTYEDFNNQYNESAEELAEEISMINPSVEDGQLADQSADQPANQPVGANNTSNGLGTWEITRSDVIFSIFQSGGDLLNATSETLSTAMTTIFATCLIIPVMAGYYFKEKGKIRRKIIVYAPDRYKPSLNRMIKEITDNMSMYLVVKILEAVVITFFYCTGFYAIGLPHWFFIGIIMGIFNIVPYVGFIVPTIVVVVYSYMLGPEMMISVIGITIVIQLFDYFLILPGIVMKTVKVTSLTAIILTLAGLKLFGIFGLIFAVPMYIFCKIVMVAAYKMLIEMYPDPVDPKEIHADEA